MAATAPLLRLDLSQLADAVGEAAFKRGQAYARGGRVRRIEWDAEQETLSGTVVGRGALYRTTAFFVTDVDGIFAFEDGECTCPVGYDCKHVAALLLTATGPAAQPAAAQPPQPAWEEQLRALIETPATRAEGTPLALELALCAAGHGAPAAYRLEARLLRPGARGGWVNGSLRWSALATWEVRRGDYREDHLAVARELHSLHRACDSGPAYWYAYGADRSIDLTACGPHLWTLLEQARRRGLELLDASRERSPVVVGDGTIAVDVTSSRGSGSTVRALLQAEGAAGHRLEPVLFLGSTGHGVVCLDRTDPAATMRLIRLARPASPELQRLVVARQALSIPAGELKRFGEQIAPALSRVATVTSSDGSFTPPEVSPPSLVLRARHGREHALEVAWEWRYLVGDSAHYAPLDPAARGLLVRDLAAERTVLSGASLGGAGLEEYGLLDDAGRPAGNALLGGLDSMRFATEVLPGLGELPGVELELEGEAPDYRDVGDTLAIDLSTAEIAGERDWFDLGVTISVEGRELPFAEVFAALASGHSHMLLADGAHFSLLEPRLQSLRQLIEESTMLADAERAGPIRLSRYQASLWSELVALGVVSEQAERWRRQVEPLLSLDRLAEHEVPATLAAELRPYQRDGFAWLATLADLELGGILADDMGLGKTLQALALVCHLRPTGSGPFLVVAPTSVVSNWVEEAARFAPHLKVTAVTDTLAKSGRAPAELTVADVVVTTYTLLRLDGHAYQSVDWAAVILDEAQYVKNHQAKTYRCVRELRAPFKLALTGTPMENNLMELWSLLSITAPGLFPDPKRFAEHYARPIERGGDAERLARLRRRIKPLVKRRTKELVASDLPPKQEQVLHVDLHPRHRKLYDRHLQRERQKILGLLGDFNRNRFTILQSITLLRQLSLSPGLADGGHADVPCAKLDALAEQLAEVVDGGHRALVFSQFTRFLAQVRGRLERDGIGHCYLDGKTRQRDRVLERFRGGDDPVFLISLKAGGFGLNLTEADYCFLLDPWWNPATENQAIDRTHRIGQTRPVNVYRLIARDTIEEKVVALAQRKAALFRGVVDDGDLFASALTAEDVRGLLE